VRTGRIAIGREEFRAGVQQEKRKIEQAT
jgi:hypothetical protein